MVGGGRDWTTLRGRGREGEQEAGRSSSWGQR